MTHEEWDERASALFETGRRETPSAVAKRRTLEQALARVEQRRARPGAPFAVVALAAALLGAVWLLPKRHEMRAPISAEERRPRASAPPAEPRQSVLAPAATILSACWPLEHGCPRYTEKPGCSGTIVNAIAPSENGIGSAGSLPCTLRVE